MITAEEAYKRSKEKIKVLVELEIEKIYQEIEKETQEGSTELFVLVNRNFLNDVVKHFKSKGYNIKEVATSYTDFDLFKVGVRISWGVESSKEVRNGEVVYTPPSDTNKGWFHRLIYGDKI